LIVNTLYMTTRRSECRY